MSFSQGFDVARKFKFAVFALAAAALVCLVPSAMAQDDDYVTIYSVIEQADSLAANGKTAQAHAKYIEAGRELMTFKQNNPGWNTQMVSYRSDYVAEKIKATAPDTAPGGNSSTSNNSTSSGSTPSGKSTTVGAASPVKLLDAGSDPKKVLRLHPAVGDKQTMTMTMKMNMTTSMGGNAMPAMNLPAMVMTMDTEVKTVSPDGDISYSILFSDADVVSDTDTATLAAALKPVLAGLRGVSGTTKISDRGVMRSMDLKAPPGTEAQLGQTLGQMKDSLSSSSSPLPEEPVGVGAKWEYRTHTKSQGMSMDQVMTFELVSMDGDTINLRNTLTQNAANQKIENPSMPGMKVDVTKFTGTGNGTTTLNLGHLLPQTASIDDSTETQMSMNVAQKKQDMDMTMRLKLDIQTK